MAFERETETGTAPGTSYVEWGSVAAGAVASLALSFVLMTFGAAAGLSAVSPWTSSSNSATAIAIGSAFWTLLVSLWSFALGGYLAARLRHRWPGAAVDEGEFRDRAHGLLSWALAVVLAAVVATAAAGSIGGAATRATASNTAVDTLVRTPRTDIAPASDAQRAELGRLLAANLSRLELNPVDRQYLTTLVANRTGAPAANAEQTVAQAFKVYRDTADRARRAGVVMAFLVAASLMVGAAISWWAAGVGGEHRDKGTVWEAFRRHPHPFKPSNLS